MLLPHQLLSMLCIHMPQHFYEVLSDSFRVKVIGFADEAQSIRGKQSAMDAILA